MDRSDSEPSHAEQVDAWLERSLHHGSPVEIVGLFRGGFEALWTTAVATLGTVTLTAIAERVLRTATAEHPFLSVINPRPNAGTRWQLQLQERLSQQPSPALIAGLRFALIELLTAIGRLTAEILSPDLHAAIAAVRPERRRPATGPQDPPATQAAKAQP
jgi:hypothetical protein